MRGLRVGDMILFRHKSSPSYRFGYVSEIKNNLVKIGHYNGDTMGGAYYDPAEIEWREYR